MEPGGVIRSAEFRLAWEDAKDVLGAPARWDGREWSYAAGSLAVTGGVTLLDRPSRRLLKAESASGPVPPVGRFARIVGPFGAEYSVALLGAFALAGISLHHQPSLDIAFDGAVASVLGAGILCQVIKYPVGRVRPYRSDSPWRFRPFRGDASFPSGHTTEAFAVMSVIAAHVENIFAQSLCYGVAASVGWSRIYHDRHWASDVVGGAVLGTTVGLAVVRHNRGSRSAAPAAGLRLEPWLAAGTGGLALTAGLP